MQHTYQLDDVERMGLILKLTMLADYLEQDDRLEPEMRESLIQSTLKLRARIENESRSEISLEHLKSIWENEQEKNL